MMLVSLLYSRENPFEPTQQYIQQIDINTTTTQQVVQPKQNVVVEPVTIQIKSAPIVVKTNNNTKQQTKKIVPKKVIVEEKFNILPFMKLSIVDDVLTIITNKKYKFKRSDKIKEENKIFFDFIGKKSFYTKSRTIVNENYDKFTVGTHLKQNYFRIVIQLSGDISLYKYSVNKKTNTITISKK